MGKGSTNKTKGSNAERYYAKVFREDLGFTFCKTSRQSNRMLDDAGIDLDFLPFNVQIKAGYAKGLNEFKTLKIIEERIPELFPPFHPIHKQVNVLIHKKDTGRGNKKKETDEIVFIREESFPIIFENSTLRTSDYVIKEGQKRGWTFEEYLNERELMIYKKDKESLVVMSFETFKKLISKETWQ